jgi:hypothetical protein
MAKTGHWLLAALLALAHLQAGAQATTLAGVRFEPEATVGGQRLQLNGAGVRFKVFLKIYAAALYAPRKLTRTEDVLQPDVAKRLQMVALRDTSGDELGKLFSRAIEDNASREEFSKSIGDVVRMGQIFAEARELKKGEVITVDYAPATGLVIGFRGKQQGDAFRSPQFASMMFKIWFGPKPPDAALQGALLGAQTTANTNVN